MAVQIFSRSEAAAHSWWNLAIHTANFIKIIDDAFDALNSRGFQTSKVCNKPLSGKNLQAFDALTKPFEIMGSILKIDKRGRLKKCPCFSGLQHPNCICWSKSEGISISINGKIIIGSVGKSVFHLSSQGRYARNPSVRTLQAGFKANCVINLMNSPKTASYVVANTENLIEAADVQNIIEATDAANVIETDDIWRRLQLKWD